MLTYIAIWGLVALGSAVLGLILAVAKRRDHSAWAAWCFILPPLLLVLLILPKNAGPRPRRPSLDEEDRQEAAKEWY
ncbi:MAG: hypothetical protein AB7E70_05215 [Hyphomicrobiaceae bacterium]